MDLVIKFLVYRYSSYNLNWDGLEIMVEKEMQTKKLSDSHGKGKNNHES